MQSAAALPLMCGLSTKNSGMPTAAPALKQTSCRFVRFSATFVLTAVRSLGTGTYAKLHHLPQCALKMDFAMELVLKSVKHSSTV